MSDIPEQTERNFLVLDEYKKGGVIFQLVVDQTLVNAFKSTEGQEMFTQPAIIMRKDPNGA